MYDGRKDAFEDKRIDTEAENKTALPCPARDRGQGGRSAGSMSGRKSVCRCSRFRQGAQCSFASVRIRSIVSDTGSDAAPTYLFYGEKNKKSGFCYCFFLPYVV